MRQPLDASLTTLVVEPTNTMLRPISNGPIPPASPVKQLILRLAGELARLHDSQPSTLDLIAEARAYLDQPEPVRVRGNATAVYEDADDSRTRIAKCIAFELHNGGSVLAAAKAILRDVELGYITLPQPEPEVPTDEEPLELLPEAARNEFASL